MKALLLLLLSLPASAIEVGQPPATLTAVNKAGDTMTGALTVNANVISNSSITTTGGLFGTTLRVTGQPGVVARLSATQSIPNAAMTEVYFGAEIGTDHGAFHDVSASSSSFIVPTGQDGDYAVTWVARFAADAAGAGRRLCDVTVDGTTIIESEVGPGVATSEPAANCLGELRGLVAGNVVKFRAYQSSGGALNLQAAASAAGTTATLRKVR